MTQAAPLLPAGLCHMDVDEQALAALPNLPDRMAYHTKRLRIVQYASGAEGVAAYKAKYPEARSIQTRATTIAFQPKPKGYSDFLCGIVDSWFISEVALAETNKAAVARLNEAMRPRRFNPDNHFSKPLSGTLLGKLADVFAKHGCHLDTSKPLSMARVRAVVKAAKGNRSAGRPFGSVGHMTDGQLVIGNQTLRIEQHHGRDCIRIVVDGARVRLRLDALAEFLALVGGEQSPSNLLCNRIGELAPEPESAPDLDPLAAILPEEWPQPSAFQSGEEAPTRPEPLSLRDRIAALKEPPPTRSLAYADDVDPLAF